jgi:nicotinamidase-related amidase
MTDTFNPKDQSTPGFYTPRQTALLLLDFHKLFVQKIGGPEAVAAFNTAVKMRNWAKSMGITVIHGLVDANLMPFPTCKGADRLNSVMAAALNSDGVDEPDELVEDRGHDEVTFTRKPGHVSALKSPGLETFLLDKGICSLILCGLSTSGCVLRTAMPATDAEFVVTVISDGCADPGEGVHDMVVGKLLPSRAYVTTAEQFQEGYSKVNQKRR